MVRCKPNPVLALPPQPTTVCPPPGTSTPTLPRPSTSASTGPAGGAASRSESVGTAATGNVGWAWGLNSSGQIGDKSTSSRALPVQVSAFTNAAVVAGGGYHSVAAKGDGTAWAWGRNAEGELGNATFGDSTVPVQVGGLAGVTAVAAGGFHSLALKSDGTVWAWGYKATTRDGANGIFLMADTLGSEAAPTVEYELRLWGRAWTGTARHLYEALSPPR